MSDFFFYLSYYSSYLLKFLYSFWWVFLTLFLFKLANYFYIWALRDIRFFTPAKWILLEIKLPEEVEKTPKAMENVFHHLWNLYDPPGNLREFWIDGKWIYCYSFEIIGRKEEIHFYIRAPKFLREHIESGIYGEYPQAEIKEIEDYVLKFGENIPNEKYDLWGCDLALNKSDSYPIRTYSYWETELTREEKVIDPLVAFFEVLGNLQEGEEIWFQIVARPITNDEHPYLEESKALIDKLMKRPPAKKEGIISKLGLSKMPLDIFNILIEGKEPISEEEKEAGLDIGLLRLSPGETEALKLIQENLTKPVYETSIRFLYIGRKEVFSKARGVVGVFGALNQFSSMDLNGFKPDKNKTKAMPWVFEKRRLYQRQRKIFQYYRFRRASPWHRSPYLLSTAELATLYHFPGKAVAPTAVLPRVEIKKAGPPWVLPTS